MNKQNVNLELIKKVFKLRKILKERPFMQLTSKDQIQHLGNILEYRAQYFLFNIYQKSEYGTSWERYMTILKTNSETRKIVRNLIIEAVTNFDVSRLNFDIPYGEPLWDSDHDNSTVDFFPVLYPFQKKHIIDYLSIISQIEFFQRLSASDPHYTWQEYFEGLQNDQNLWRKFARAFQQGLWEMDFGGNLEDTDTENIVLQYHIANACYILEQRSKEKKHGWASIFPNFWE